MNEQLNDDQWQQIEDHLYNGRKIAAIKLMRQWTGVDLKDAKELVEQHEQELRSQNPTRFAKSKAGGCATAMFVLAASAVIVTASAAAVLAPAFIDTACVLVLLNGY